MQVNSYSTKSLSTKTLTRNWVVLDASGQSLGRLASAAAARLIGKHRPDYTPHIDCGDHVIIINSSKVRLTGRKWDKRVYFYHTGYPGSQQKISPRRIFDKDPRRLIERAVRGMIASNRLGRVQGKHLHVYTDANHEHEAQQPITLSI